MEKKLIWIIQKLTYDELRNMMFREIGYAICYMDYFPDRKKFFPKKKLNQKMIIHLHSNKKIDMNNVGYMQRKRVEKLIKYFSENDNRNNYKKLMWLKEQIFLFQDETENMC